MYTSENNWYSWQYGDGPEFGRQTGELKFKTNFKIVPSNVKSFKEELLIAAKSTMDYYPDLRPAIFFSGGIDSEIMLRSYLTAGANPSVYIVRYENDYNIYDVSHAVTICSLLNVDYTIIDFNLEKFYENDAEHISELAQIDRPRALPYCKFIELVDGLPILGASDITAVRTNDDYSNQGTWLIRCWEHDIGWSKYARVINKPAIPEWFKWTPGLVKSFMNLHWFKKLVNDGYPGKLGTNSTKIIGYREAYPNLIDRKKQTGFERIDHLVEEVDKSLLIKYNKFTYRNYFERTIDSL